MFFARCEKRVAILRFRTKGSSERRREKPSTGAVRHKTEEVLRRKIYVVRLSTAFEPIIHNFSTEGGKTGGEVQFTPSAVMPSACGFLVVLCLTVFAPRPADAATGATLLRLFLTDGVSIVSFGEYARIHDRVIFSMPVGGTPEQPRLHVVNIPANRVDWARTERYAAAARYHWYAATRGETDFARLSGEVARVLNDIALSTDRRSALTSAEEVRRSLAAWPAEHFGYRQSEVRDIVALLDEAISNLRASIGIQEFELSLEASAPDVPLEPLLGMPTPSEQLDQLFHVAALTDQVRDRIALLQAGLSLLEDPVAGFAPSVVAALRASISREIQEEMAIDERYAVMSRRLLQSATRAAETARVEAAERVLGQVPREDARLGRKRPDEIVALRAALQARVEDARRLRLLKDRWTIRQSLYREWQRSAGVQVLQLVKLRPTLEAIRHLDGPSPEILAGAKRRLAGGADRLHRIGVNVPEDLRKANDLLVGAWRFAENAVTARHAAIVQGNVDTAWNASSAAAASLLMLDTAQEEIRTLLEPPRLK